jgi:hypothetical protein
MRKPFDLLVEGLLVSLSRENKTPFELFTAGVQGWDAELWRQLDGGRLGSHCV